MKKVLLFFYMFLFSITTWSQSQQKQLPASGILRPNLVSAGLSLPLGNFSVSHTAGFGFEYSRCRYSYGKSQGKGVILFSYTLNTGISYFSGKKKIISNYPYQYPSNTWLYAMGGLMFLPAPSYNLSMTAGPSLMLYNKNSIFCLTAKIELNYFIKKKIAISPSIQLLKQPGTNTFWITGVKGGYCF